MHECRDHIKTIDAMRRNIADDERKNPAHSSHEADGWKFGNHGTGMTRVNNVRTDAPDDDPDSSDEDEPDVGPRRYFQPMGKAVIPRSAPPPTEAELDVIRRAFPQREIDAMRRQRT